MGLKSRDLNIGANLPELKRRVTQEHINLYASASGDFNPIHIDPEFAKKTSLGGTVAHGMLVMAYLSEFMTESFGHKETCVPRGAVLGVFLLLFGSTKLPKLARSLGSSMTEFKKGLRGDAPPDEEKPKIEGEGGEDEDASSSTDKTE